MFARRFVNCIFFCLLLAGSAAHALTNQLHDHPSPYLALHGDDPVAWQDWTEKAVSMAREENKLLYISVGYFSCHWCHVMQQESYRNQDVATLLNENYIPVKVDRELEPALDARLIEFARHTQGRAGWPLNVFLTPDGHPLYAVLYMPPQNFMQVLTKLDSLWRREGRNLLNIAAQESQGALGPGEPTLEGVDVNGMVNKVLSEGMSAADTMEGGFGQAMKFPMAPQLDFLLDRYGEQPDEALGEFLKLTLDAMAGNGMYDHIGDGFFRYSTEPGWGTPHFEKMLYDNAQLAVLYLRAGELFREPRFTEVAERTLDFMGREMAGKSGALVASFSAVDGEGIEGGYYLWQPAELSAVLGEEERRVAELVWGLEGPPRFEAGYLPRRGVSLDETASRLGMSQSEASARLEAAREKLFSARASRVLPVDTKLLAGWNGLALVAFAEAARVTGKERYRNQARKIRDYIIGELWDGESLARAVDGQQRLGNPSLEDYAYVAAGLRAWALLTEDNADFRIATDVIAQAWKRFYDRGWRRSEGSLIAAEAPRDLIADGPMPSPAAVVMRTTVQLGEHARGGGLDKLALSALNSSAGRLTADWLWTVSHVQALLEAARAP